MRITLPRWSISVIAAAGILIAVGIAAGFAANSRRQSEHIARAMTGGDPTRAPALIRRYGCAGCHTISGIPGGDGQVGGSLEDLRKRVYIAGVVGNSPDNLIQWIVAPRAFAPRTAMPTTGISEAEARDVAAYLYAR